MAKEKHNYHMFYFKNTLYPGNLNSGFKRTDFTCTQCMINNKNLECFTFSLIFQFFVWVPLKDMDLDSDHFLNLEQLITGAFTDTVGYIF